MTLFILLMYAFFASWVTWQFGLLVSGVCHVSFLWGMFLWHARWHQYGEDRKQWSKEFTAAIKAMNKTHEGDKPGSSMVM